MLHDAAQMQAAHHRVDRAVGKQAPHLGADIDDAGVAAGAEHDQAEIAHVGHQHALVHQVGIGPPLLGVVAPAEMVLAAGLERAHARDLAAVVEMPVEQQPFVAVIHDPGAARFHLGRGRHLGGGKDDAALQQHAALVEHAGIDVHRHRAAAAAADDGVDRRRQRAHVVPMPVRDGDLLDLAEIEAEVAAVADEDGAFGAGVEKQRYAGSRRCVSAGAAHSRDWPPAASRRRFPWRPPARHWRIPTRRTTSC